MKIETMKISDLKGAGYNPRVALKPGDPEFERLRKSIETFGDVEPIVWNARTKRVVGGHQRLAVLREMGVKNTEVSVVDLKEDDEMLLNVALNKIKGGWDYDKLTGILKDFAPDEAKLSGFSPQELTILLADVNAAADAAITCVSEDMAKEEPGAGGDHELDDFEDAGTEVSEGAGISSGIQGASWVIAMIFPTGESAAEWLNEKGWGEQYKEGTRSTVVRME